MLSNTILRTWFVKWFVDSEIRQTVCRYEVFQWPMYTDSDIWHVSKNERSVENARNHGPLRSGRSSGRLLFDCRRGAATKILAFPHKNPWTDTPSTFFPWQLERRAKTSVCPGVAWRKWSNFRGGASDFFLPAWTLFKERWCIDCVCTSSVKIPPSKTPTNRHFPRGMILLPWAELTHKRLLAAGVAAEARAADGQLWWFRNLVFTSWWNYIYITISLKTISSVFDEQKSHNIRWVVILIAWSFSNFYTVLIMLQYCYMHDMCLHSGYERKHLYETQFITWYFIVWYISVIFSIATNLTPVSPQKIPAFKKERSKQTQR